MERVLNGGYIDFNCLIFSFHVIFVNLKFLDTLIVLLFLFEALQEKFVLNS